MPATLIILFVLYLLIRLPWIFTVPMVEAPDEFAHYWVINYIREHLAMPSPEAVAAGGPSAVYGSMPPFGYLAHVFFTLLFPATLTTLAERFGSLAAGLVTVWAAFKTGKLLFPSSKLFAFVLPLLIVVHPQYVFVTTYANNDSTVSAAASVAIYLAAVSLKYGLNIFRSLILGLAIALILVSKYSGLCVVPVILIFMVAAGWLNNARVKDTVSNLAMLVMLPVVITGGYFIRNFLVFDGDFLGTRTMYKTWSETFHIEVHGQVSMWRTIKDNLWWKQVFESFWGVFGYQSRYLPAKVYDTYFFIVLAGLGGLIVQALSGMKSLLGSTEKKTFVESAIWTMMALAFLANIYAMIYAASVNLGGPQGRYLFATELPAMALLLKGMTVYGKAGKVMAVSFAVFSFVTCVFAWNLLYQLFGFHAKPY